MVGSRAACFLMPAAFLVRVQSSFLIARVEGGVDVGRNFDDTTPAMVEQEFANYVLSLEIQASWRNHASN